MTDLMQNADLGAILRDFHAKGKPTAMICHGPSRRSPRCRRPPSSAARSSRATSRTP
jgi:hypothetical protein